MRRLRDRQLAATLPPRRQRDQHVYIVRLGRRYKIGISCDPERRIAHLHLPQEPDSVSVFSTHRARTVEAELHKVFAEYRTKGEWFEFPDDVATLALFYLVETLANGRLKTKYDCKNEVVW